MTSPQLPAEAPAGTGSPWAAEQLRASFWIAGWPWGRCCGPGPGPDPLPSKGKRHAPGPQEPCRGSPLSATHPGSPTPDLAGFWPCVPPPPTPNHDISSHPLAAPQPRAAWPWGHRLGPTCSQLKEALWENPAPLLQAPGDPPSRPQLTFSCLDLQTLHCKCRCAGKGVFWPQLNLHHDLQARTPPNFTVLVGWVAAVRHPRGPVGGGGGAWRPRDLLMEARGPGADMEPSRHPEVLSPKAPPTQPGPLHNPSPESRLRGSPTEGPGEASPDWEPLSRRATLLKVKSHKNPGGCLHYPFLVPKEPQVVKSYRQAPHWHSWVN